MNVVHRCDQPLQQPNQTGQCKTTIRSDNANHQNERHIDRFKTDLDEDDENRTVAADNNQPPTILQVQSLSSVVLR